MPLPEITGARGHARPAGWLGPAIAVTGTLFLVGLYGAASFGLAGNLDLTPFSSGILDMDVSRVLRDWATQQPGTRTNAHPLYKLFLAPWAVALQPHPTSVAQALDVVRALLAVSVALHCAVVGVLTRQLTRGALLPAIAAAGLCGVSFSSLLAGAIPESAAFACWGAVLPLVLSLARRGRPFGPGEALAWALVGTVCFGFTVSQLLWWAVGLGSRLVLAHRHGDVGVGDGVRGWLRGPILAVGLTIVLGGAGLATQEALYPGTTATAEKTVFETDRVFFRTEQLRSEPLAHLGLLARHFVLDDFAAPHPTPSRYLMELYPLDYWSLSIEETRWSDRDPAQRALSALVLLFVVVGLAGLRRADAAFAAPLLGLALQFALHALYGREYVLYAPHWHGVLVAVLVAGAWNALPSTRRLLATGWLVLGLGLLVNNWDVLDGIYREYESGLESAVRDADGRLLEPGRN